MWLEAEPVLGVGGASCVGCWELTWEGRLEAGPRRQVQTLTKDDKDAQDEEDPSDGEAADPQGVVICGQPRGE